MAIYCPKQSNYKKAGYGNACFDMHPKSAIAEGNLDIH